jgi:threonine aldolase
VIDARPAVSSSDADRIRRSCTRYLSHHYPVSPKQVFQELADLTDAEIEADMYGSGGVIEQFESRVAALLGKDAAVFMPSGTMCQQIAIRIWTDRRGIPTTALHPRNHLDRPEQFGYRRLHGIHGIHVGPIDGLIELDDLKAIREPMGALLLELPQREIGGRLPAWDDLVSLTSWAREQGIPVHMDGARLWEAQPFYGRSHAEIADLFDSVYVSFYKGLGGIAGAALAGPEDIIAEARVWLRRHGGNLIRVYPYVLSAQLGLDRHLPRMREYYERAVQIAAVLSDVSKLEITPSPPQTNMMHIYLDGQPDRLLSAALEVSEEAGIWMFSRLAPTVFSQRSRLEFTVGAATMDLSNGEIRNLFVSLLERT